MTEDRCETFEAFGTCGDITTEPHKDETSAKWAETLVDVVFDDPDCERLQVSSIIHAIQEMGFPYAEQVKKLEQQLDPKNEDLTVDKPMLRYVAQKWLKSCEEGKDDDNSFEDERNGTDFAHPDNKASSFLDVQLKKDDHYKNEISGLYAMLNASEEKVKSMQLDNVVLKKSVKNLQTALQKAEDHKSHAEESKAALDDLLLLEKSKRTAHVSALEKQLTLAKDQLDIFAKDNEELSANKIDDNRIIKDLRDELLAKCNELDDLVQENGILKSHLEQNNKRLKHAEIEICQLKNTNFELMEHGREWKRTIQDVKEENDVLRKKILVLSSRFKKGETVTSSNSDLGSDSSNIGEVSIFSPACFSSPLSSEKLSAELAESGGEELGIMETTNKVLRPLKNATKVGASLAHVHKPMRKRKLFGVPVLESLPESKRFRSGHHEATSMVGLYQKEALPLERATSFAINLTTHQKLLEAVRNTLYIHPHLFGCIRDFVARQVSSDIKGTELLNEDLTFLFYEFCTAQQSNPFRGRQFLLAICEEMPTQSNSVAVQSSHLTEFAIEPFDNNDAPQNYPNSTLESKSNDRSETVHAMPAATTDLIDFQSDYTIYDTDEILHPEGAVEVMLHRNLQNSLAEPETSSSSSDSVNGPSWSADTKTVANINCSDAAGIKSTMAIDYTDFLHEFLDNNPHTSERKLFHSSSLRDLDNPVLPTDRNICEEFANGASGTLFCEELTNSPDFNDEGPEGRIIGFEDWNAASTLPENDFSLVNNISDEMNQSSPSASATATEPACSTVKAISSGRGSVESGEVFHSSEYLNLQPSFELNSNCNSELVYSSSATYLETLDSAVFFDVDSQDEALNEASFEGCLDESEKWLKPSKVLSIQPAPHRYFKFMLKISLLLCSLLILLLLLYLGLSKAVLMDEEYKNVLLAHGGKYVRNEVLPY